jgi:predicted dinucleotide-utilizing enzyme
MMHDGFICLQRAAQVAECTARDAVEEYRKMHLERMQDLYLAMMSADQELIRRLQAQKGNHGSANIRGRQV